MPIEVLGFGCENCTALQQAVESVAAELALPAAVVRVEDPAAIASYGMLRTPGLAIDGKVVLAGRQPSRGELATILTTAAMQSC